MIHLADVIRRAFTDLEFYRKDRMDAGIAGTKILAILVGIGITLSMVVAAPGLVTFAFSGFPEKLKAAYPDNLVVSIAESGLIVNQEQPYYIENNLFEDKAHKYLVIFDEGDVLAPDLAANSTFVLFKKEYMITMGQNNSQQIIPFSQMGTTTVTLEKGTVVSFVDKFGPYFTPAVIGGGFVFFLLIIVLGTFFWVVFHAVYLLFPAALVFLLMMGAQRKIPYAEAYVLVLYASIPALVFDYGMDMLFGPSPMSFSYTLTLLVFAFGNMWRLYVRK